MTLLEAVLYLVANEPNSIDEWVEAGMWQAVKAITADPPDKNWGKQELDSLIKEAKNN